MPVSSPYPSLPALRLRWTDRVRTLDLEITARGGQNYQVAARSDTGDVPGSVTRFPLGDGDLDRQLGAVELALARSAASARRPAPVDERPLQELGAHMFEFLFAGEVREILASVRSQTAREGVPMQLRLRIRPAELAALPWELLYDRGRDEYLCLSNPLVRHLEVLEPLQPLAVTSPLRVLVMVARPTGYAGLDVENEKQRIHDALSDLEAQRLVQVSWVAGQTWRDLQSALDEGSWHVFHFIGHGGFDAEMGEGFLALARESGRVHRLGASDLGLLLGDHRSLRLVVLNACESARASVGDVYSSTAAVLTRRGVTAVVAMQYEISDESAISFARGLYSGVAHRLPVDQAVIRGRRDIKLSRWNSLEWITPVLYLRSPRGDLFELAAPPRYDHRSPGPRGDVSVQEPAEPGPAARLPSPRGSRPLVPRRPGAQLGLMEHGGSVEVVAFSPDATRLATGSTDRTARVWSVETAGELARITHDGGVLAVAFSPDGTRLATGSHDNTARVWALDTGREVARMAHSGGVLAMAFSPDGTWLATGSYDGTARVWALDTGQELARMAHPSIMAMAFSSDGTRLATGGRAEARLWEADTGEGVARMPHDGGVLAVAFSADGTRFATGSQDRTARIWTAVTGQLVARLEHGGGVLAVAFSADGTRLATGSYDNTARVWAVRTQSEIARARHDSILAMTLSADGKRLATGSGDETALLWDAETGRVLARMRHRNRVVAVTFSPDGAMLATGSSDNTARIWRA
jgi:WD40 repeat protein